MDTTYPRIAFVHAEGAWCGYNVLSGRVGRKVTDGKGAVGRGRWEGNGGKGMGEMGADEMGAVSNKKEEPHRSSSFLYWVIQITPEFF